MGHFHQHFTSSFYVQRAHKHKKDSQLKQFFARSGSARIKSLLKHVDEIDAMSLNCQLDKSAKAKEKVCLENCDQSFTSENRTL